MDYTVQRGDTIAKISKLMGSDWQQLKTLNPTAVGRSRANGNWFFREGATITNTPKKSFASTLKSVQSETAQKGTEGVTAPRKNSTAGAVQPSEKKAAGSSLGTDIDQMLKCTTMTDPALLQTDWLTGLAGDKTEQSAMMANTSTAKTELAGAEAVMNAAEGASSVDNEGTVVASWYGKNHHGKTMANGKPYNMYGATIAHKSIPLGTKVLLENPETGQKATATVTDRGPFVSGRDVDLSYGLAERLSLKKQGVGNLVMKVL